jgi:ribosome-associated protein
MVVGKDILGGRRPSRDGTRRTNAHLEWSQRLRQWVRHDRLGTADGGEKLAVAERRCEPARIDPLVLDLRELTVITDYFLVCHGTSTTHIRAIADRVMERMEEQDPPPGRRKPPSHSGSCSTTGDVVVHIFSEEQREFYALERLWSDAPRTDLALRMSDPMADESPPKARGSACAS